MTTGVLKALPGKLYIKRHSSSILYFQVIEDLVYRLYKANISVLSQEIYQNDPFQRVENLKVIPKMAVFFFFTSQ